MIEVEKMKKVLLGFVLFFAGSGFLYAEEIYKTYTDMGEVEEPALTVSEVLASRDEHHRQIITVEGQVGELTFKETGGSSRCFGSSRTTRRRGSTFTPGDTWRESRTGAGSESGTATASTRSIFCSNGRTS